MSAYKISFISDIKAFVCKISFIPDIKAFVSISLIDEYSVVNHVKIVSRSHDPSLIIQLGSLLCHHSINEEPLALYALGALIARPTLVSSYAGIFYFVERLRPTEAQAHFRVFSNSGLLMLYTETWALGRRL